MPCYITFLHVSEKVTAKQLLKSTAKVTSLLCTGFQRLKDWCSALWTLPHPHLHFPLGAVGFLGWEGLAETPTPVTLLLWHWHILAWWDTACGREMGGREHRDDFAASRSHLWPHAAAARSQPCCKKSAWGCPHQQTSLRKQRKHRPPLPPKLHHHLAKNERFRMRENVFDSFTQWWWHQQRWFNCSSTYFSEWFPMRTVKCIIHPMEDCPFPLKGSY